MRRGLTTCSPVCCCSVCRGRWESHGSNTPEARTLAVANGVGVFDCSFLGLFCLILTKPTLVLRTGSNPRHSIGAVGGRWGVLFGSLLFNPNQTDAGVKDRFRP